MGAQTSIDKAHVLALTLPADLSPVQAVEELNIKPKYWKDLLDDTPITRKDIIHLQDPLNLQVLHPIRRLGTVLSQLLVVN